jgi:hypothetical protein
MSTTIMCILFAAAFTFKDDKITWLWNHNNLVAIILVISSILLGTQWIKYQRLLNNVKQN